MSKLITPTQAESKLNELGALKGRVKTNFEKLVGRSEGKITLALATDKRPEYKPPVELLEDLPDEDEEDMFGDLD